MVELRRSYEHFDQRRFDCLACMDLIESADLASQKTLCGLGVRIADHVNAPQYNIPSVILTAVLGSVSLRYVSLSTGTELDTITT